MSCQNVSCMLMGVILIILALQTGGGEGVRLCGSRLADLLNFVCERHGGFHTPAKRREAPKRSSNHNRAVVEILRPLSRRQETEIGSVDSAGSLGDGGATFSFESGVVDECCKKQCSLSTLVSYCANVHQVANINLEDILPTVTVDETSASLEDLTGQEYQQINAGSFEDTQMASPDAESSNHPNLGLSIRNRPVFIVLSQPQEDQPLGEYSF